MAFVHAVEPGDLEQKSIMLCESIRKFTGPYSHSKIYAVSPRKGKRVSEKTEEYYKELNVEYVYKDLNKAWYEYPFVNTAYAAQYVESLYTDKPLTIVLCDTDTVFLNSPNQLDLSNDKEIVALTPLDTLSSEIAQNENEPLSPYWTQIFSIVGVKTTNLWKVKSIIENQEVIAYFNNGLVASKSTSKIFREVVESMERASKLDFFNKLQNGSLERFFLDQAFLAAVIQKIGQSKVKLLDSNYNFPFNLISNARSIVLDNLVHIHYHNSFYFKTSLKYFHKRSEYYDFFSKRIPFKLKGLPLIIIAIKSHIPQKLRNKLRGTWIINYVFILSRKIGLEF